MNVKMIISRSFGARLGFSNIFSVRSYANDVKSVKLTQKTETGILEYDEVPIFEKDQALEDLINRMRNKSRLNPGDQNRLHDKKPYETSMEWYHDTIKYKRKMLGRYGLKALDAPPGIAWPTPEDVEDAKEYEQVAYPVSLQEGWKLIEERKRVAAEEIKLREMDIEQKLRNMEKWKAELAAKVAKKEALERAAREKKEKMIEMVRCEFGVNLDPRSPKFKELVEKKELEDKKKKKAMKKEEKAAKLIERINKQFEVGGTFTKEAKEAPSKEAKEAKPFKEAKEAKPSKEAKKEVSPEDEQPKDPRPNDPKPA